MKRSHMQLFLLDQHLYCYHCGECLQVGLLLPIRIDLMHRICKAFKATHRLCAVTSAGRALAERHEAAWAQWKRDRGKKEDGSDVRVTAVLGGPAASAAATGPRESEV